MQKRSQIAQSRAAGNVPLSDPSYFVVMVDYGKSREAIVDPETTRSGAVDLVQEAMGDGHSVQFVHHIHDGVCEDISEEVFWEVTARLVERDEPISCTEYNFIELHVSTTAAQAFQREV